MTLALLAPPQLHPELAIVRLPLREEFKPVVVATFAEAWERLERLSRRDEIAPYMQQLKYGIAAVNNLVRLAESAALSESESTLKPEIRAQQKAFAVKMSDEVLKTARGHILAAPETTPGKYTMMEIANSLMLVKGRAEHSPARESRNLFDRVLGKLVSELSG